MQFFKSPLKSIQFGLCLLACIALLASCGEDTKLTRHIPKDAAGVLALDMKSLALKSMDFQEILKLENLQNMFESSSEDSVGKAVRNSGIDFINKGYIYGKSTAPGTGYGAAVVALSDPAAFEAFVKKLNDGGEVSEEGGIKTAQIDASIFVAWNKTEAIFVFAQENGKETAASLANLKKEESIVGVTTFDEVEKLDADIALWVNMGGIQSLVPQSPYAASTTQMNLTDSYVTATCNFEDGQIVFDAKTFANEDMAKKYNFMKANVKPEIIEAIPGSSVIGLGGFGIEIPTLTSYLESEKLLEMYDPLIQQNLGIGAKEVLAMFDGNIAFSLNGLSMKEVSRMNYLTGEEMVVQAPDFDYSIVFGIANKETANKLLTHFTEAGMLAKSDKYYSVANEVFIVEKGDAFVLTHTEARRQAAIDGNGEKLNSELSGLFANNAGAFYVNTNNIPAEFLTGENAIVGTHLSKLSLEDITYTSSTMKDKVSTSRCVIRFKAKDENSLITISKIVKGYGETMSPFQYTVPSDSTVVDDGISAEEAAADAVQE
jgi:hypothetical protein